MFPELSDFLLRVKRLQNILIHFFRICLFCYLCHRLRYKCFFFPVTSLIQTFFVHHTVWFGQLHFLRQLVQNFITFFTLSQKIYKGNCLIFLDRAFHQNVPDSRSSPACKYSLLLNQHIVSSLNGIELSGNAVQHFICFVTELHCPLQTVTLNAQLILHISFFRLLLLLSRQLNLNIPELFHKTFAPCLIFPKILLYQLFDRFLVTIKAVGCRQNRIFLAVTIVDFLYKNFLDS